MKSSESKSELLTEGQAADFLHISSSFLRDIRTGRAGKRPPPHIRAGRRVLYERQELVEWLKSVSSKISTAGDNR